MRACAMLVAATVAWATPAAALTLDASGYTRMRLVDANNFDLDAATPIDAARVQAYMRAYLTLSGQLDRVHLVSSLDLAGSDFDKGAIMGFDNAARQRPIAVMLRELYLDYGFPWADSTLRLGRQPLRLGNGIVAAIHRDAFKLCASLPNTGAKLGFVVARGGKGITQWSDGAPAPPGAAVAPGRAATTTLNDPGGSPHELDVLVALLEGTLGDRLHYQAFIAQQLVLIEESTIPAKGYMDVNAEARFGNLVLAAEAAAMAASSVDGTLAYARACYHTGPIELELAAGRGSGDADPGPGPRHGFQSLFLDETALAYDPLFAAELHGYDGTDAANARADGFSNVTFLRPCLTWHPTPEAAVGVGYTRVLATEARPLGSGLVGANAGSSTRRSINAGDAVDVRASYRWGASTWYALAAAFVPGDLYPAPGAANAATKLEIGTEVKF